VKHKGFVERRYQHPSNFPAAVGWGRKPKESRLAAIPILHHQGFIRLSSFAMISISVISFFPFPFLHSSSLEFVLLFISKSNSLYRHGVLVNDFVFSFAFFFLARQCNTTTASGAFSPPIPSQISSYIYQQLNPLWNRDRDRLKSVVLFSFSDAKLYFFCYRNVV
jgi:hypothetical protein